MIKPFRFGAQVSNARSRDAWVDKARKLEDLGYSTMFMPDHFDEQLAPTPALWAAADATSTLRIGSLVYDNDFRHPIVLAKEAATLDVLSGGRLEFGLGAGWLRTDYEQSGIAYDTPATRIDRMEEGLSIIKSHFSGETFSHAGRHYSITDHTGTPRPVQQPHPPIIIGAGAKRMLTLAGREADIVSVNFNLQSGAIDAAMAVTGTATATKEKLDWIRAGAGARFDDLELSVTVFMAAIVDNPTEMAGAVAGGFGLSADDALAMPHFLMGSVDSMIDTLQQRREEYGFSYIVFSGGSDETMAPVVAKLAGA
jgi:probable F420-dependent oxidoreductase